MAQFAADKILDSINSAIVCLDQSLRVCYVNSTAEALFGASSSTLLGKDFDRLFSQVEFNTITSSLSDFWPQAQALTEHEARLTLSNGKSIIADYSIYPLDDTQPEGITLVEIRPVDRQLQIAREEISQLHNRASQQFARGMAHEIQNPLGGIRGAAQLLEKEITQPSMKEYTDVIISEVDRLQALVKNMLGPNTKVDRKPVNILEILEHIRKLLLAAEPDKFIIRRDYDPSIPELLADRDQLIQAFLNIALNAVQALEKDGEITFKTRVGRQFTIGQTSHPLVMQVGIIDNGRGISSELGNTIFLPMVTDKAQGSGLGLTIAQEIISRHGGLIRPESLTSGTMFSIFLPLGES
jgi:two-component system nitrogen regulation sensor histidine kinase GlnL